MSEATPLSSAPRGKGGAQAVELAVAIETKANKLSLEKEVQLYLRIMVSKTEPVCNAITLISSSSFS